jgi:hypothetical protein
MAAFNHISRAHELLLQFHQPSNKLRKSDGIPIDLFKSLIRTHSWHFNSLEGIRKPSYPLEAFLDDRNPPLSSSLSPSLQQEDFEVDLSILLLLFWQTYQSCHNSDLCSVHSSSAILPPLDTSSFSGNHWTEKWKEKFDVPSDLCLFDASVCQHNPELMSTIRMLIGGCSCCLGGRNQYQSQRPSGGDQIPREMFIQFFLVSILKGDSEYFDLSSVAKSSTHTGVGVGVSDPADLSFHSEIAPSDFEDSQLSALTANFLSSFESPPITVSNYGETSIPVSTMQDSGPFVTPTKRDRHLRRKSRRFFTAVTDVYQSPISKPVYFNEGWRQCWLASRFVFREKRSDDSSLLLLGLERYLTPRWWRHFLERVIGSQEFDLATDALFTTVMVLFIGFYPSIGLMVTWIFYAVIETTLRVYFKGVRRFEDYH